MKQFFQNNKILSIVLIIAVAFGGYKLYTKWKK